MRRTAMIMALSAGLAMSASLPIPAYARAGDLVRGVEELVKALGGRNKVIERLRILGQTQAVENIQKAVNDGGVGLDRPTGYPFTVVELRRLLEESPATAVERMTSPMPPELSRQITAVARMAAFRHLLKVAPGVYFAPELDSVHVVVSEPEQFLAILKEMRRAKSARDPQSKFANCSFETCLGSSGASVSAACGDIGLQVSTKGHVTLSVDSGAGILSVRIGE